MRTFLWILVFVMWWFLPLAHAESVRQYWSFPDFLVQQDASDFEGRVWAHTTLVTHRKILGVSEVFFTLPDNPKRFEYFVEITGMVNERSPSKPLWQESRLNFGDLEFVDQSSLYSYPDETNFAQTYLFLSPANLWSSQMSYAEQDEYQQFVLGVHLEGEFSTESYGQIFVLPEPAMCGMFVVAYIFKRRR